MKICQDDNVSYCGIIIQVVVIQYWVFQTLQGRFLRLPAPRVVTQSFEPLDP